MMSIGTTLYATAVETTKMYADVAVKFGFGDQYFACLN